MGEKIALGFGLSSNVGATPSFYGEPLPDACPPQDAQSLPDGVVLRLVANNPPIAEDFRPCREEKGKKRPSFCDECRWAGYSVWAFETERHILEKIAKLPKNSHLKFIAKIQVGPAVGLACPWPNSTKHLSFWMYSTFGPHNAVVDVEPI